MSQRQQDPVRVAMVGLGWWGKKMTDLLMAAKGNIEIVRAVEPNAAAIAEYAAGHGLQLSAALDDALEDRAVEAVILATPHALHGEQIERAVARGKHVFCEKPLAMTRAEALRAVSLCRDAGLVLGLGHERRFEPPIQNILKLADTGALGRLLQIEANFSHDKFLTLDRNNWRLNPAHAPAGGMTATGIHLLDLSVRLMGPATSVLCACEGLASDLPQGDTVSAYVRFKGGGTAYVAATLATPFVSRFAVFGSKGWIDVRDKAHVEAPDGWVVTKGIGANPIEVAEVAAAEPVLDNLRAFADAIRGSAAYPISATDMIENIALLEAVTKSARSGNIEMVEG